MMRFRTLGLAVLITGYAYTYAAVLPDLKCPPLFEYAPRADFVSGKTILPLPKSEEEHAVYEAFLRDRYGFQTKEIVWGNKYPMIIHGGDESSFATKPNFTNPKVDPTEYDAVVIGTGPAGLTAGIYLTDAGKRVLVLEKEASLGGLAVGGETTGGVRYGRGAAYFTSMEGEIYDAYKHLGFGQYKKKFTIHGATDSYYWNGKFYEGLWENPVAMAELPASFELFKFYLDHADKIGLIPGQPFEEYENLILDTMTMKEWVNSYPAEMKKLAEKNPEAKRIYARFLADTKINPANPMQGPLGLLDLYGRSAMGDHTDKVSAALFANFYVSELSARFTGNMGTGSAMEGVIKKLRKRSKLVNIQTSAPLAKIRTTDAGVEVYFVKDGVTHFAKAKTAVYSAQLKTGIQTIEDYEKIAPDHYATVKGLKYRHYVVVNAHVEGHPWKKSYDTWVRDDKTYSQKDFTDVIDGRWQDFHGEDLPRTDNRGVLTIYDPLPEAALDDGLSNAKMTELTEKALENMKAILEPLDKKADDGSPVNIIAAEINRWPYSIHLAEPGHFRTKAKILKQPVGNIYFANNNMGAPAIEEGVYRGLRAAHDIIKKLDGKISRPPAK